MWSDEITNYQQKSMINIKKCIISISHKIYNKNSLGHLGLEKKAEKLATISYKG